MLVDSLLTFSDKQALASGFSTNTLDTKAKSNGHSGGPINLIGHGILPTSITVSVTVQHSDDNATFTNLVTSSTFTAAQLAKGQALYVPVTYKRYVRLSYTVTGTVTQGSISAFLHNKQDLPGNYTAAVGMGAFPT